MGYIPYIGNDICKWYVMWRSIAAAENRRESKGGDKKYYCAR